MAEANYNGRKTSLVYLENGVCANLSSSRDVLSRVIHDGRVFSCWHAFCNKSGVTKERRHEHEYIHQPESMEHP